MPGEIPSARGGKPHATGVLRGLEMDLQLIDWLNGRAYHIDLQTGVTAFVELHTDHEHYAVGHLDSKLPAIGA